MTKIRSIKKICLGISIVTAIIISYSNTAHGAPMTNCIGGQNRYETAVEICKNGWVESSEYVVLATGANFPDALSAAPLAQKYKAPILLIEKENVPLSVIRELKRLKVKRAFVVGGTGAISAEIENSIKSMGIITERLAGPTRYETAIEIAKQIGVPNGEIAITNGYEFAEALSISSIAAKKQMPLILISKEELPQCVTDFLKDKKVEKSYILGGLELVNDEVAKGFLNVDRIEGKDKYERNINILKKFEKDIDFTNVGIATGRDFPDALTGSAFASLTSAPIVLVDDEELKDVTLNYIKEKLPLSKTIDVFGLTGAVKEEAIEQITGNKIIEELPQFTVPKNGEEIALVTTNKGIIKIKFFPQYAPLAVENFKTHGKEGYYNGLTFHRVIEDFMVQGGDPKGDGTGGESIWKKPFYDEFSPKLHNFRGALSMANSGKNTNGSQFFIVQKNKADSEIVEQMKAADRMSYSNGVISKYEEVGGTPWLDYHHSVFGQVFEGMDVIDTIANVPVGVNDKPIQDVTIEKIEFVKYGQ